MGASNGPHILGTLVPVEEPSTASIPDSCAAARVDSFDHLVGVACGPFSVLIHGGVMGADESEFSLELKRTSSRSDDDTDGICSPLETRETATRVLLKTLSALTCALSSLSSSVTSTLCSPFVSSVTLPAVLDEMMSALLGALIGASPWEYERNRRS